MTATSSTRVTDVDTWAAILTGCLIQGEGAFAFCYVHEEDGCPLWNECRWTVVAESLREAWTAGREVERVSDENCARSALGQLAGEYDKARGVMKARPSDYTDGYLDGLDWAITAISSALGHGPTDSGPSCCDHHAGWADAPACDDGESDGLSDEEP